MYCKEDHDVLEKSAQSILTASIENNNNNNNNNSNISNNNHSSELGSMSGGFFFLFIHYTYIYMFLFTENNVGTLWGFLPKPDIDLRNDM